MPNIRQQKKRVRTAGKQRLENLHYRSTAKTLAKRLEAAVQEGDNERVVAEHRELVRGLDPPAPRRGGHFTAIPRRAGRRRRHASSSRRRVAPTDLGFGASRENAHGLSP